VIFTRAVIRSLAVTALLLATVPADKWLDDFHQILDEMSSHYANLDAAIQDRRMDLPALRKRTEDAIHNAKTDDDAKREIERFLQAFGDGHVDVRWPSAETPKAPEATQKPKSLCERFGYDQVIRPGVNFGRLPEYRADDDADTKEFPGGILTLSNGRRAGIVRIGLFSAQTHPVLCQAVEAAWKRDAAEECDFGCEMDFERRVDDAATAALERRVASLRKEGATAIVIDLTRNGGGGNWVEPAARVLTPVALRSPRIGFLHHQHWVTSFESRLKDIDHDLAQHDDAKLREAKNVFTRALEIAKTPCDHTGVWNDPPVAPKCPMVVPDLIYTTGSLAYAKPGSVNADWARGSVFSPSVYEYHEGANLLPLYVLVDQYTASASEYFVAMMKDNKAATIIGEATRGAGCGHTDGGVYATLKNSGGRLSLPDCARFRADGTNEISGIIPDVLVPWSPYESAYQRASKTRKALESAVAPPEIRLAAKAPHS